jgi:hypothetical protein
MKIAVTGGGGGPLRGAVGLAQRSGSAVLRRSWRGPSSIFQMIPRSEIANAEWISCANANPRTRYEIRDKVRLNLEKFVWSSSRKIAMLCERSYDPLKDAVERRLRMVRC